MNDHNIYDDAKECIRNVNVHTKEPVPPVIINIAPLNSLIC